MEENVRVLRAPMIDDRCLFNSQLVGRPSEIRKQLMNLLVRAQFTGNKLPSSQWIRYR